MRCLIIDFDSGTLSPGELDLVQRSMGESASQRFRRDFFCLHARSLGLLEHYTNKPDCFRMGAKSIRSQCGEADMDEEQRVIGKLSWFSTLGTRAHIIIDSWRIASISMTLCEIATGNHYSIPLECHEFRPADPDSPRPPYPSARTGAASQCVEWVQTWGFWFDCVFLYWRCGTFIRRNYSALARSTQFWSSYSGYLREMRKWWLLNDKIQLFPCWLYC